MIDQRTENDVPMQPSPLVGRWGNALGAGFVVVPNVLIRSQKHLGITPIEVVVLLNLMVHWWTEDRIPFVGSDTIAERSGLGLRTVQRCFQSLQRKGLIHRVRRGDSKIAFDLSGLKAKLAEIAPRDTWFRPGLLETHQPAVQDGEPPGFHPPAATAKSTATALGFKPIAGDPR